MLCVSFKSVQLFLSVLSIEFAFNCVLLSKKLYNFIYAATDRRPEHCADGASEVGANSTTDSLKNPADNGRTFVFADLLSRLGILILGFGLATGTGTKHI